MSSWKWGPFCLSLNVLIHPAAQEQEKSMSFPTTNPDSSVMIFIFQTYSRCNIQMIWVQLKSESSEMIGILLYTNF